MEFFSKPISIKASEKINSQMEKAVCKILIDNQNLNNHIYPGFLCKIPFKSTFLYVLITTYDILELVIKNDNRFIIKFLEMNYKHENKNYSIILYNNIKLDNTRKIFKDEESGLLLVEIKSEERKNYFFFELDDDLLKKEETKKI